MDSSEVLEKYDDKTIRVTCAGCIGSNFVRILLQGKPTQTIILELLRFHELNDESC